MTLWMPNKKKPLYAPMLATFGGGSVRGFKGSAGGGGTTTLIGISTAHFPNATPSDNLTFPSGTQAGDTAIIVQGFSGYNGSGGVAAGESSLSVTPDSQTDHVWGEYGGMTNYVDTVYVVNSLTGSQVSGGYLYLTTTNGSISTYSLATMIILRDASAPAIRSTHGPTRPSNRTSQYYDEDSGYLPSSGVNTSGLLFNVVTDRVGANRYANRGNFTLESEEYDYQGNIFVQPCYSISYADYVTSGYTRTLTRLLASSQSDYSANSIVISV